MTQEVQRNYLEINSIEDLNKVTDPQEEYSFDGLGTSLKSLIEFISK